MKDSYISNTDLIQKLKAGMPEKCILSKASDRYGYASDASFYRLIPKVVVQPENEQHIQYIFQIARSAHIPVVFRAAGSSLSGQSITDGILVDISRYWRKHAIQDSGRSVRLQPGVIGEIANRYLIPYERRIGPDPASIGTCMIGGIVSNNASGMCCGVHRNSYHTLQDIRFILPNGYLYDSAIQSDKERFLSENQDLVSTLKNVRQSIHRSPELTRMIRENYQRKNTTGYSLNAFVDYHHPFDIFAHLLVGGEGTLAFICEVTLKTIPDPAFKSTGLFVFRSLEEAISLVAHFQSLGAEAVELMDYASLQSVKDQHGVPPEIRSVGTGSAVLLVEFQEASEADLQTKISAAEHDLSKHSLEFNSGFTRDEAFQKRIWNVRKGLYPSVGAVRQSGTSVIIEDIAFDQHDLAPATKDVRATLDKHGYQNGIIFGHAKDGNLHFVITQEFDRKGKEQYDGLIKEIVQLVTQKYSGSLKAEHGTGRNMAPFVREEWGNALYDMMKMVKSSVDPLNMLNPDVIINSNPQAHLNDIKQLPSVHQIIDTCVECGFCESVCPSHDLTTSPRRRIVLWREMTRLAAGNSRERAVADQIRSEYEYEAVDTCATDGLCALACPVDIDTGKMMKYVRETRHSVTSLRIADWSVEHFSIVAQSIRLALRTVQEVQAIIGGKRFTRMMNWLHEKSGAVIPGWNSYFPEAARYTAKSIMADHSQPDLIYFPSCLNRNLGDLPGEYSSMSTVTAFEAILGKAGLQYRYPQNLKNLCCGTPWQSKGFSGAYKKMANKTVQSLWKSTNAGRIPVVMDTSPCTSTMVHYDDILSGNQLKKWESLIIYDVVEYLDKIVLRRCQPVTKMRKVVLHPTCSTRKMDHIEVMRSIASRCAEQVIIPVDAGCCGFAGDRGLLHPELTRSASAAEGNEVRKISAEGYYSTSRTCEAAMSSAAEVNFQSIIQLVHNTLT